MASALTEEGQQLAEFSDRFSPVFVKELRQGLRANYFVMPFIGAQIMAILAVLLEVFFGWFGGGVAFSGGFFFPFLSIMFSIVMPLTLFAALQPEISIGRNIELLLLSNLSRWQIVRGKLFVGCALSGLMMISLLPYLLIRYFVGNVELSENIMTVITLMFGNVLMNAIVIGASGIKNYVGRIFMIGFVFVSYSIVATALGVASVSGGGGVAAILGVGAASALYVILGLQLGRAKLRVFENPLDPLSIAIVVVMIIVSPILVWLTVIMLGSIGPMWGMLAGGTVISTLIVVSLLLDRGPGKEKPATWAQP